MSNSKGKKHQIQVQGLKPKGQQMTTESDKKEGGDLEHHSVATESRDEDSSTPTHQQEDSQSYTNTNSISASKSGMGDAWNAIVRKYTTNEKQEADDDDDDDMSESDLTDSKDV